MDRFRWNGDKFSVSACTIEFEEYVDHPTTKNESMDRDVILVILRKSNTGTPYSGISILNPHERSSDEDDYGLNVAVKRAIKAYINDDMPDMGPKTRERAAKDMYRWYRIYTYTKVNYPELFDKMVQEESVRVRKVAEQQRQTILELDAIFDKAFAKVNKKIESGELVNRRVTRLPLTA